MASMVSDCGSIEDATIFRSLSEPGKTYHLHQARPPARPHEAKTSSALRECRRGELRRQLDLRSASSGVRSTYRVRSDDLRSRESSSSRAENGHALPQS